jgi:dipeptidase D
MRGAKNIDAALLKGKMLLSLDHSKEGEIIVSCAGLIKVKMNMPVKSAAIPDGYIPYSLRIGGLQGGHSGNDIHLGKGNANYLMGRVLRELSKKIEYYLCSMTGGMKANAIPRENQVIIYISKSDNEELRRHCEKWDSIYKKELQYSDKDVYLKLVEAKHTDNLVLSKEAANRLISFLRVAPNGVQTTSRNIDGLPESSLNIGVINANKNEVTIEITIRSNVKTLGYDIFNRLKEISALLGMDLQVEAESPALEYKVNSRFRDLCMRVYEEMYGEKPQIKAIHAITEGGVFNEKIPGIDYCLISPNIYDLHSPSERLSVSSTQRVWEYLKKVLKEV